MNVKSAFLNEILSEEVNVEQPKGFKGLKLLNHVYKLKKALYGLKQTPRAWYERLTTYLLKKNLRVEVDRTLFIHKTKIKLLVVEIYVDDIIFGANSSDLALSFAKEVNKEFEMSMASELRFFLGLHIRQFKNGIFLY